MAFIQLGWVSRVDEMILARVSSGFAGEKVWEDIQVVPGFVGREMRLLGKQRKKRAPDLRSMGKVKGGVEWVLWFFGGLRITCLQQVQNFLFNVLGNITGADGAGDAAAFAGAMSGEWSQLIILQCRAGFIGLSEYSPINAANRSWGSTGCEFLEKSEHFSHSVVDLLALLENEVLKSFHSFRVCCHVVPYSSLKEILHDFVGTSGYRCGVLHSFPVERIEQGIG
ncbi:hypothetical protein Tco_0963946 [Tanacetum coccineum]